MADATPLVVGTGKPRTLSLPKQVAAAGGIAKWNDRSPEKARQWRMFEGLCQATTVSEAMAEVDSIMTMGHKMWVYIYFRTLHNKNPDLYYALLLSNPEKLMPVAYTPTVGEACQKFGRMPMWARGCYVCIEDRGKVADVLRDYAQAHLELDAATGKYLCDCIVFSDGGRILGLGDLGAWGMGIPIGKLDLYTVCGGVNPKRTVPVIIDAGNMDVDGNTAGLVIREHADYTGCKRDRVRVKNEAGALVNKVYFGEGNMIEEFFTACVEVFGDKVLAQFEDFNSNDAFPLLNIYRSKFLTYNDDIQGTAAVAVAGILAALKIKYPANKDLMARMPMETFLFFGSGSANIGAAQLLMAGGVPKKQIFLTGSRGLLWISEDGKTGCYRNDEQKFFAVSPEPEWPHRKLVDIVQHVKPTVLVGAAGRAPGAFDRAVIEMMVNVNQDDDPKHDDPWERPVVFALSNPTSQAECTSTDAIQWSRGKVIYGSGSGMPPVTFAGHEHQPGQVNNVYIFPAMSFAAIHCQAKQITDKLFLVAACAVANSLSEDELHHNRIMPKLARIREVSQNVATAVILACQEEGLAQRKVGDDWAAVHADVGKAMWKPPEMYTGK